GRLPGRLAPCWWGLRARSGVPSRPRARMTDLSAPGPGEGVIFYGARRLLFLLHGAASVVLIGAATHHALLMRHYLRGRFEHAALERIYARTVAVAYVITFALGAALYPSYRVHVRGLYLDRYAPGYAMLFDVKEMYASLSLIIAVALGVLSGTSWRAEMPWL